MAMEVVSHLRKEVRIVEGSRHLEDDACDRAQRELAGR